MERASMLVADRVTIMGILNLTPDSFSDGGRFVKDGELELDAALAAGRALLRDGADILDVGGESTRPGSQRVEVAEEIRRTAPLIERLTKSVDAPISIDTRKARVAEAALDAGASIVNDVSGLQHDPELAALVAERGAGLVIGHLRGEPATMQQDIQFSGAADALDCVARELSDSVELAVRAGVARERMVIDPGIGFGKQLEHNLALLANLGVLRERVGCPLLVGPSRKSFLGTLTGDPVAEREVATQAACAVAVFAGADALRVHDVAAGVRTAKVARALREAKERS